MGLEVIYLVRHGYRSNWTVDPNTGTYTSPVRTPTGIPSDPALASYGVAQANQLATHLQTLDPRIAEIYTSPFYRCLQTLQPYTEAHRATHGSVRVHVEPGLGEFYGKARFDHPSPAPLAELRTHFEHLHPTFETGEPVIVPSVKGETIEQLHDRFAYALDRIIAHVDSKADGPRAIVVCSHAAGVIAAGRALTGNMPEGVDEEDFHAYTCGLSTFVRRKGKVSDAGVRWSPEQPHDVPDVQWREGNGVGGGWDCVLDSDCSFLDGGEERGWHFTGDEGFMDPSLAASQTDTNEGVGVKGAGSRL